jgi:hypothetical protein
MALFSADCRRSGMRCRLAVGQTFTGRCHTAGARRVDETLVEL